MLLVTGLLLSASAYQAYYIGNSLTDCLHYGEFAEAVQAKGKEYDWGRTMIPGAPIDWLWANGATDCLSDNEYGCYRNALTNFTWDCMTVQPCLRGLNDDKSASGNFINLAKGKSPDVQVYVYATWPDQPWGDFSDMWLRTQANCTVECYRLDASKEYYEKLVTELRAQHPDLAKPVRLIPAGHVLYELDQRMKRGEVAGYTSVHQFYADGCHLNGKGCYVVACAFFSTLFKQDCAGLKYDGYDGMTASLADLIQDAAWKVVSQHPMTGVSVTASHQVLPVPAVPKPRQQTPAFTLAGKAFTTGRWSASGGKIMVGHPGRVLLYPPAR